MQVDRIPNPNNGGSFIVMQSGDVERQNPIDHFRNVMVRMNYELDLSILLAKKFPYPQFLYHNVLLKKAEAEWEEEYQRIRTIKLSDELCQLANADSKKTQIKLLKSISLESDELLAYTYMVWEKYGYTFSQYTSHHNPNGMEGAKFPTVYNIDEDGSDLIGDTTLSESQLKQVIKQRHVLIAKFFDSGSNWHCFFSTYRSIDGREAHNDGQPHLHFISNLWGLSREQVLTQLLSKNYSLPSMPHIDFHTHRNPRKKSGSCE